MSVIMLLPQSSGVYVQITNQQDIQTSKMYFKSVSLIEPNNNSVHKSGTPVLIEVVGDNWVVATYYNWDGNDNSTFNWVGIITTYLPEGDGEHVLRTYTKGHWDAQPIEWSTKVYTFTTDDTKPNITLNSPLNESIQYSEVNVSLTILDSNGISSVIYNWDGTSNLSAVAPYEFLIPATVGIHNLQVFVFDDAGNVADAEFIFQMADPSTTGTESTIELESIDPLLLVTGGLGVGIICILVILFRKRV